MFSFIMEDESIIHQRLCLGMMCMSPFTFLFLRYVQPPNWGKTYKNHMGATVVVPPRIGWCLFELPNLLWAFVCYFYNGPTDAPIALPNKMLLGLFVGHYINRAIIYPLTLNPHSKPLPLEIVLAAMLYTTLNGYIQSQALCGQFVEAFPQGWVSSPQFCFGLVVFGFGVAINCQSDHILRNLRGKSTSAPQNSSPLSSTSKIKTISRNSNTQYVIPYGGLFRFVSAPHYFGEIIEWTGFAIASSNHSYASWSFVLFTCANLVPRALAHHEWYLEKFQEDYPQLNRKAVIPLLW